MNSILKLDHLVSTSDFYIGNTFKVDTNTSGLKEECSFIRGSLNWDPKFFRHYLYRINFNQSASYILKHIKTGKIYVGSSGKIYIRIAKHKFLFGKKEHSNLNLVELMKTAEIKDFEVTIIFTKTRDDAYTLEQYLVNYYKDSHFLLNVASDVRYARLGAKNSAEQTRRIIEANTGRVPTDDTRKLMSDFHRTDPRAIDQFKTILEGKRRKVMVNSIEYESLIQAGRLSGIPESTLRKALRKGTDSSIKWITDNSSPILGRTLSLERRKSISEFRKTNPRAIEQLNSLREKTRKKITLNDVQYESITQAETITGIDQSIIQRVINLTGQRNNDSYVITYEKPKSKRVRILGKEYESTRHASQELSLSKNHLKAKIQSSSKNCVDYQYIQ